MDLSWLNVNEVVKQMIKANSNFEGRFLENVIL